MKTLETLVKDARIRKGVAAAITSKGAYWTMADLSSLIGASGGDGVGNSAPDLRLHLELRHYRDGFVEAGVIETSWHQNHGTHVTFHPIPTLLSCRDAESVVALLVAFAEERGFEVVTKHLAKDVEALGWTWAPPSPDEELSK